MKVPHDKQKIQGKEREDIIEHYHRGFDSFFDLTPKEREKIYRAAGRHAQKLQKNMLDEYEARFGGDNANT